MNNCPVIVVIAYNRPKALSRLLNSLNNGIYEDGADLIISIDKGGDIKVLKTANDYTWQHGNKQIIRREKKLGLKNHIIACGDLTYKYDCVIILEDDIYVSPYFYKYALDAINYYKDNTRISGISLYKHSINYGCDLPFYTMEDDSDVYFMQFASSWGQIWIKEWWDEFKQWYKKITSINTINGVPAYIKNWPESSWLKYFISFMVENDKYFVYPRLSLTTNYSDTGGEHVKNQDNRLQIPIQLIDKKYSFKQLSSSLSIYDVYFELLPEIFKRINKQLSEYDFDVDLYGLKDAQSLQKEIILTSKPTSACLLSFGLNLKPIEANVLLNTNGDDIYLTFNKNINRRFNRYQHAYKMFRYNFSLLSVKKYMYFKWQDLTRKLKNKIRIE